MIKKVPVSTSIEWISSSWRLTKSSYGLILGIAIISAIIQYVCNNIPFLGPILGSTFSFFFTVGVYNIVSKIIKKQDVVFSDLLILFNDSKLFKRCLSYLILIVVLAIPSAIFQAYSGVDYKEISYTSPIFILMSLYYIIISALLYFSLAIIVFQNKSLKESISISFNAVLKNFFPLIVSGILVCVFGIICMILLVIPFIFVFLPILIPFQFIVYATIFEDLNLPLTFEKKQDSNSIKEEDHSPVGI